MTSDSRSFSFSLFYFYFFFLFPFYFFFPLRSDHTSHRIVIDPIGVLSTKLLPTDSLSLYIYPLLFPPPKVLLLFISPWFPCIASSFYFCLPILYSFLLSSCFPSFFILLPTYHTTARARPRWCSFLLLSYPGFNLILNSHSIILSKVPLQAVGYNNSPTNNKRGKALSPGKHQPRGGYAEIPITNRAKRKLLSTVSLLSAITENFAKLSTHSFGPLNLLTQPFLTGSKSSLSFFHFIFFSRSSSSGFTAWSELTQKLSSKIWCSNDLLVYKTGEMVVATKMIGRLSQYDSYLF